MIIQSVCHCSRLPPYEPPRSGRSIICQPAAMFHYTIRLHTVLILSRRTLLVDAQRCAMRCAQQRKKVCAHVKIYRYAAAPSKYSNVWFTVFATAVLRSAYMVRYLRQKMVRIAESVRMTTHMVRYTCIQRTWFFAPVGYFPRPSFFCA